MPYTYLNGNILPMEHASLPLNDIGLLRGYGVCDVARTRSRIPHLLDRHLTRFRNSAEVLRITIPYTDTELTEAVNQLTAYNTTEEASIKFIATGGPSQDGTTFNPETPTIYVMVNSFTPLPEQYFQNGVKLALHGHQRVLPEVKSIDYLTMVHNQPLRDKAGAFELLYHHNGELREAATSNIFIVKDGIVSTPIRHILPGITRSVVINMSEAVERTILVDELLRADEVFLTATNKDILPVVQIDDVQIGNGKPGPRTKELLSKFLLSNTTS